MNKQEHKPSAFEPVDEEAQFKLSRREKRERDRRKKLQKTKKMNKREHLREVEAKLSLLELKYKAAKEAVFEDGISDEEFFKRQSRVSNLSSQLSIARFKRQQLREGKPALGFLPNSTGQTGDNTKGART